MIAHIDTSGINIDLDEDIKKYITKKIGKLDRYLPRHARKTVRAEIKLRETGNRLGNKYECEAILHVPGTSLYAKESTLNMFAAVDIVEAKLHNQARTYKQTHLAHLRAHHTGFLGRLRVHFMK